MQLLPSNVLFTAIPSPLRGSSSEIRLTVMVSPRMLAPDQNERHVGDFCFGATAWPTRLWNLRNSMSVRWNGGAPVLARLAQPFRQVEDLDARLWTELFANRRVIPHRFEDFRRRKFIPFPMGVMNTVVERYYKPLAAEPEARLAQI